MPKLYFMRHGQTLFNLLRRKQGWCDSPLTELGIEQAKTVGATLRERGLAFDHAYSSTSERACDTLELAFPDQPYERVKGLKEWNFGKFEGASEDLNPRRRTAIFTKCSMTARAKTSFASASWRPSPSSYSALGMRACYA